MRLDAEFFRNYDGIPSLADFRGDLDCSLMTGHLKAFAAKRLAGYEGLVLRERGASRVF